MKVSSPDGVKVNDAIDVKEEFGTHAELFFFFFFLSSFSTASSSIDIPNSPLFATLGLSLSPSLNRLSQVYNVSSGKSTPQWLSESKKRALRKDEEYR